MSSAPPAAEQSAQPALSARYPLLLASIAYASGLVVARLLWNPPVWWIAGSVALLLAACFFMRREHSMAALALALISIAIIAALNLQLTGLGPLAIANDPDFDLITNCEQVLVTAHVTHEAQPLVERFGHARQSIDVKTEEITAEGKSYPMRFGIRLALYSKFGDSEQAEAAADLEPGSPLPRLYYGEHIRFLARLRQPRNFGNPGAFDYRGFLNEQSIVALASVPAEKVERLPGFSGSRLGLWRSQVRRSLLAKIGMLWRGDDAALMSAMLLGDRSGVDHELTLDYQRTGAYHILVVAGLKVGILAFTLLWLLRLARMPAWSATLVTIAGCVAYAFITEANPPVVRATAMLAIYLLTRLLYRQRSELNAVGAAALGVLVWSPRALFDGSFQLTFVSILAIAGIALPIFERTSRLLAKALRNFSSTDFDLALPPRLVQFRLDLRMLLQRLSRLLGNRLAEWLLLGCCRVAMAACELVLLSAILQLALALPMAWYFHRAVAVGIPVNALVVPLHSLLLPLAGTALLLSYLWLQLARVPASAATALLHVTNRIVESLAHWHLSGIPVGDLRIAQPALSIMVLAVAAFVFAVITARMRHGAVPSLAALLVAAIAVCLPPAPNRRPNALELTAIDVGQGDSLLLISPQGKTLLIDAGGELGPPGPGRFDIGEEVVSSYLWARGVSQLDAVALTHAHADHIGGMQAVIRNFHPRELWLGPEPDTAPVRALLQSASVEEVMVIRRHLHEELDFGGAKIRILGPPADWAVSPGRAQNNDSLVMKASFGATSILLEGDAEKRIEHELAAEGPGANLLKVAHHGSATSTQPELLAAVHPQMAVISAGFRNSFHHPRAEVLTRLQAASVRTLRTDTMGAATFYLDGKTTEAEVSH